MELKPITESKLIILEGADDEGLFGKLMESLGISGVQMVQCIGTGEMPRVIKTVKITKGFDIVSSLGIVRDADNDAEGAFRSVCNALRFAGLDVPEKPLTITEGKPHVIVVVCPCGSSKGMIEDVCLRSVEDSREMRCVGRYFECLHREGIEMPKNMSKAKVQTYLASRPETYPKLGVAAQKGEWNFDSGAFEEIKIFLKAL